MLVTNTFISWNINLENTNLSEISLKTSQRRWVFKTLSLNLGRCLFTTFHGFLPEYEWFLFLNHHSCRLFYRPQAWMFIVFYSFKGKVPPARESPNQNWDRKLHASKKIDRPEGLTCSYLICFTTTLNITKCRSITC